MANVTELKTGKGIFRMKSKLIAQLKGCWLVRFNPDTKLPEVLDEHRMLLADTGICALSDHGAVLPIEAITNLVGVLYAPLTPDKEQIAKLLSKSKFADMVDKSHNYWRQK